MGCVKTNAMTGASSFAVKAVYRPSTLRKHDTSRKKADCSETGKKGSKKGCFGGEAGKKLGRTTR